MKVEFPTIVGGTTDFTSHGATWRIKKINRSEYSLHKVGERHPNFAGSPRMRFGDSEQIREDIARIAASGKLPASKAYNIH